MPIYKYSCGNCDETTTALHLSNEKLLDCEKCQHSGSLTKMLGRPLVYKTHNSDPAEETGEVTKQFIEENREILKQQQQEAEKKTYE